VGTAEGTLAGNNLPIPFEDLLGVIKNLPPHEDESLFPRVWKVGRVSPILKIDNPTDESHSRPISILPVLSKRGA